MNNDVNSPKPTGKRKLSGMQNMGYWLSLIILTLVVLSMLLPSAPLFIRLFVPFPKLKDTYHWKGVVEAVAINQSSKNNWTSHRFFINTESGRHELRFGYWGRKSIPDNPFYIDKSIGEVWYHPAYGTIKYEFKITHGKLAGKTYKASYESSINHYQKFFIDSDYIESVLIILIPYLFGVYQIRKQKKRHWPKLKKYPIKQNPKTP